jgi:hypothetical protein
MLAAIAVFVLIPAPYASASSGLVVKDTAKWEKAGGKKHPGAIQERTATGSATGREAIATATATCPKGTKAAGGGFEAPSSIAVVGLVYESVKVGHRSWRVSAQLLDLGAPSTLTLTAYVYCRAHFPATQTRSSTVPTGGQPQVGPTGSATCRRGADAVAGGFTMPPPLQGSMVSSIYFDSMRAGDNAWDTRVVTGPAGPSAFTTEAYCSKKIPAPVPASASSPPNATDFTISSASASCDSGLAPAAGGFSQPASGLASFLIVFESRRVGGAWQVSGLHSGNSPAVTLNSFGYCA